MKRVLTALACIVVGTFLGFSIWGYYFGDLKQKKTINVGACVKGLQATLAFGDNKGFSYTHLAWGPAIFPMETWIVGTPGSVFGFIKSPLCPDDDVDAYADQWHRDNPNTDQDTGLPIPPGDNDDGEPQEGAAPSKKG